MPNPPRPTHATISISNDLNALAQDLRRVSRIKGVATDPGAYLVWQALANMTATLAAVTDSIAGQWLTDTDIDRGHRHHRHPEPCRSRGSAPTHSTGATAKKFAYLYLGTRSQADEWLVTLDRLPFDTFSIHQDPAAVLRGYEHPVEIATHNNGTVLTPSDMTKVRKWRGAIYRHNRILEMKAGA